MKRSTLILLLVALIGGALIYYLEIKPGKPRDEEETADKTRPAFGFSREDINSLTLTRGGENTKLENQNGKWVITQPVNAPADESAINSLVADLTGARIERELAAAPEDVKSYGLNSPAVKLDIKLKDGKSHQVDLGSKDVTGSSAYARIDGSPKVALVPASMLTSADKPLNDLRDRSIVGATPQEINSFKINNDSGSFELVQQKAKQEPGQESGQGAAQASTWKIKSPAEADADETAVSTLLNDLTSAKATDVVSENGDDPAKYGLNKSKLGLQVKLTAGGERTVNIGSKEGDKYFAKVSDRAQIFKVDQAFYDKLNTKLATLRSKEIVKLAPGDIKTIQIKNPNGTLAAEDKDGKLLVTLPADKKGKEVQVFKIFSPLQTKASELIDKPSAAILAKLAKPVIEARITTKSGKTTVIKLSAADGDDAYLRVEGQPGVYKVSKTMVEDLSFKPDEALQ